MRLTDEHVRAVGGNPEGVTAGSIASALRQFSNATAPKPVLAAPVPAV